MPQLASRLVYDRNAILAGEAWRLFTGHLVHFSPSHFVYDLLAFALAGWIIEQRSHARFGLVCIVATALIGVTVFAFAPAVRFYGGLSGVACAAIGYLSLTCINEPGPSRWVCAAVLALLAAKIGWECVSGSPVFATASNSGFVVLPSIHVVGWSSGVLVWFACRSRQGSLFHGDVRT